MNLDEFQSVLDQVINHSIPDSQKSPLVRKLNQQVAEDQENSLEACFRGNSFLDNSATTHDSNRSVKTDIINLPAIQSSASFNNVTPSSCTLPLDPSKPIRMNESNKVENSLQNLQQFCDDFMTRNPEYRPPTNPDAPSTSSSSCLQNGHSGHQPPITASSSASLPNRRNGNCEPLEIEMRDLGRKAQIVEYSSSLGVMKASGQSVDTFIDLSGSLGGGGEPSSNATKPNRAELAQVAACNTVYSNPTNGSHVSNSSFNNECSAARSNVFGSKSPTIKSKALNTVEKFFNPLGLNTAVIEGNGKQFSCFLFLFL